MFFHWSLSDSKSAQVTRTLLGILDLNHAVVWMVFTHPLISPLPLFPWEHRKYWILKTKNEFPLISVI